MVIFKRKEVERKYSELPELPPLPEIPRSNYDGEPKEESFEESFNEPDISIKQSDLKFLPSFPNSSIGKGMSQEAIKSVINSKEDSSNQEFPIESSIMNENKVSFSKPLKPVEPIPTLAKPISIAQIPLVRSNYQIPIEKKIIPPAEKEQKQEEPVYVRIDRFKNALASFQEVLGRISQIESLLEQVKEQKKKEEEELRRWENEIGIIRERIESIDIGVFSKLD